MRMIGAFLILFAASVLAEATPSVAQTADLGDGWHLRGRLGETAPAARGDPGPAFGAIVHFGPGLSDRAAPRGEMSLGLATRHWGGALPGRDAWTFRPGTSIGASLAYVRTDLRIYSGMFWTIEAGSSEAHGLDAADPAYVTRTARQGAGRLGRKSEASVSAFAMVAGMSFDIAPDQTVNLGYRYLNFVGAPGHPGTTISLAPGRGRNEVHELRAGLRYAFR